MRKLLPIATRLGLSAVLLGGSYSAYSQSKTPAPSEVVPQAALEHLRKNKQALRLTDTDIADVVLSGQSVSKNSGVKHIYLQQRYQGIEIHNAVSNVNMTKDDQVLNVGDRFQKDASHRLAARQSAPMAASAAVAAAARHVGLSLKQDLAVQKQTGAKNGETVFSTAGIALEPITAKLVY